MPPVFEETGLMQKSARRAGKGDYGKRELDEAPIDLKQLFQQRGFGGNNRVRLSTNSSKATTLSRVQRIPKAGGVRRVEGIHCRGGGAGVQDIVGRNEGEVAGVKRGVRPGKKRAQGGGLHVKRGSLAEKGNWERRSDARKKRR